MDLNVYLVDFLRAFLTPWHVLQGITILVVVGIVGWLDWGRVNFFDLLFSSLTRNNYPYNVLAKIPFR